MADGGVVTANIFAGEVCTYVGTNTIFSRHIASMSMPGRRPKQLLQSIRTINLESIPTHHSTTSTTPSTSMHQPRRSLGTSTMYKSIGYAHFSDGDDDDDDATISRDLSKSDCDCI